MFTNPVIVEVNSNVFLGRGISYTFLMTALVVTVRVFYLMYKGTNDWKLYKLAFDKRQGIFNFVSHLKVVSIMGIVAIACSVIFDTSYTALFYAKVTSSDQTIGKALNSSSFYLKHSKNTTHSLFSAVFQPFCDLSARYCRCTAMSRFSL